MKKEQEKILLDMVGNNGLIDLKAIARLVGEGKKEINYSNPYYVAVRLLSQGIAQARAKLTDAIGVKG